MMTQSRDAVPPQAAASGRLAVGVPTAWHTLDTAQAAAQLNTPVSHGLSQAEAARRLAEYGPNELQAVARVSPWALLLDQFKNILIVILLVAVGLSVVLGEGIEALVIAVIVLFAVLLGFVQISPRAGHRSLAPDGRAHGHGAARW